MHLSRRARERVLVMSLALFLCGAAWSVAVSHGPLAKKFLSGPVGNFIGDGCFYFSVPGWLVAISIFGYNSGSNVLTQFAAVAANTMLYGVLVILILRTARSFVSRTD